YLLKKGDVDRAWSTADYIIEGEYETGAQEQLYIENNGVIAIGNAREGLTVWGSMQCPYYVQKALMTIFDLPPEKVRIIQTETGGGFGGKEEYPSMIAAHAALLACKSGKPVKLIYDRAGDMAATSQVIRDNVDLAALLDRALGLSSYHDKKQKFAEHNRTNPEIRKGIGFATFMHGAGFTGSGEQYLKSTAAVEATNEGRIRVLVASTEIGQGTQTILSQIAADTLGLDYDDIEIAQPDTANVPNSGPTVASRTCMIVGKLVESACIALKQSLVHSGFLFAGYTPTEFATACAAYTAKFGALRSFSEYEPPPGVQWDDERYQGDAYGAFAWAAYVAEVSVDMTTYEIRVD